MALPHQIWPLLVKGSYNSPQNLKHCPKLVFCPWRTTQYTSIHVDSIRGFAHAAGFAATRRCLQFLATGSIASSAKRRYLSYADGDFEVFRRQGRHVAPMGVKFGAQFHPHRCNDKAIGPPKLKILYRNFTKFRNINAPQGISCARFSRNLHTLYPVFRVR